MSETIVDIDERNAAALLIDESNRRPVVVDFWADWCQPCKSFTPVLEKLAREYDGAFLLAKVNADEQGMIAQQFGVRSLPTVVVMLNGQPVDGFTGAQPESVVREVLTPYLPAPWDNLLQAAQAAIAAGDFQAALAPLRQAMDDSGGQTDIALLYARALVECLRLDEAEKVLDGIRLVDQEANYEQVRALLEIKREAARSPEIDALEQRLAQNPDDMDIRHQLAGQYTNAGMHREALEQLVTILRRDLNHGDGATKKLLLDIIASLGKGDPLAAEYQRKLYSLLY